MTWESAGSLGLGPVSGWLADLPAEPWETLDPVRLHRTLTGCLLTDNELADGEAAWRRMPDPFRRAHPAPAIAEEKTA